MPAQIPYLTAYYFRAHMYTCVPHHVREDMTWMADHGTKGVAIGVLEQDLVAARENIDLIVREAERVGMRLWVVPARWGGLVAGCPKVPSIFASIHPECWAHQANGSPQFSAFGPLMSVHHPATETFFRDHLERLLADWPIAGVIWDEPKNLQHQDHSDAARAVDGWRADPAWHLQAHCDFFARINAAIAAKAPACVRSLFSFGHYAEHRLDIIEAMAGIDGLDEFGLDGRPWSLEHRAELRDTNTKSLINHGPAYLAAAARHGRRSFMLIENLATTNAALNVMDTGLGQIAALGLDHLTYYYYPRSVEDPARQMALMGKHLQAIAAGRVAATV